MFTFYKFCHVHILFIMHGSYTDYILVIMLLKILTFCSRTDDRLFSTTKSDVRMDCEDFRIFPFV
jgi:hypothetical protein